MERFVGRSRDVLSVLPCASFPSCGVSSRLISSSCSYEASLLGELTSADLGLGGSASGMIASGDLRIGNPSQSRPRIKSQPPAGRSWQTRRVSRTSLSPIQLSRHLQMAGSVSSVRINTSHRDKIQFLLFVVNFLQHLLQLTLRPLPIVCLLRGFYFRWLLRYRRSFGWFFHSLGRISWTNERMPTRPAAQVSRARGLRVVPQRRTIPCAASSSG